MKKAVVLAILFVVVLLAVIAEAQQPKKVPRIGYLTLTASPRGPEAFLQGLRELGYIEGQNIVIEPRHAADRAERLPDLAAELVRLNIDVIVAGLRKARWLPSKRPRRFQLCSTESAILLRKG